MFIRPPALSVKTLRLGVLVALFHAKETMLNVSASRGLVLTLPLTSLSRYVLTTCDLNVIINGFFLEVRHCLNTQGDWSKIDGAFNAEKFYWQVVTLLESGELGRTLLARINR